VDTMEKENAKENAKRRVAKQNAEQKDANDKALKN